MYKRSFGRRKSTAFCLGGTKPIASRSITSFGVSTFSTDVLLSILCRDASLSGAYICCEWRGEYQQQPKIFLKKSRIDKKYCCLLKCTPYIFEFTSAIEQNDNYELHQQFVKEFNGDYSPYSLLIAFHTEVNNARFLLGMWGANANSQKTDWLQLNAYGGQSSEVLVSNEEFSYFQMDEEWDDWAQQLPSISSFCRR